MSKTWNINGKRESLPEASGTQKIDMVNHPPHYERDGAMECIEEMILIFGIEKVMGFCLCNAWKYRYRAADKNGIEDIKKSDWYMAKYKELKEESDKKNKTTWITTTSDNGNIRLC